MTREEFERSEFSDDLKNYLVWYEGPCLYSVKIDVKPEATKKKYRVGVYVHESYLDSVPVGGKEGNNYSRLLQWAFNNAARLINQHKEREKRHTINGVLKNGTVSVEPPTRTR